MHPIGYDEIMKVGYSLGADGALPTEAWLRCGNICTILSQEEGMDLEACIIHCAVGYAYIYYSGADDLIILESLLYTRGSMRGRRATPHSVSNILPEFLPLKWQRVLVASLHNLRDAIESGVLKSSVVRRILKLQALDTKLHDDEAERIALQMTMARLERRLINESVKKDADITEVTRSLKRLLDDEEQK